MELGLARTPYDLAKCLLMLYKTIRKLLNRFITFSKMHQDKNATRKRKTSCRVKNIFLRLMEAFHEITDLSWRTEIISNRIGFARIMQICMYRRYKRIVKMNVWLTACQPRHCVE